MKISRLKSMSWRDVRQDFAQLNKNLFNIIESLDPDNTFKLYKISYPFGSEILKKGVFYIPNNNNELVPITNPTINKHVRSDLLYNLNSNPVCMATKNNAEIYLEYDDMIIPYLKLQPGSLLGTWGILEHIQPNDTSYHPESIWNMSAGARSLFMIPKIGDKTFHHRLQQEYNIPLPAPKNLNEQWHIFKKIVANNTSEVNWEFELICFSAKWFEYQNDPRWQPFYNYLLKSTWHNSSYLRNQSFWNLIFSIIRKEEKILPSSYINDMIKQIHAITCGFALGFAPSVSQEDAPITTIQNAYVNGAYKLKDYLPIIMAPYQFDGTRPVYFSLLNITSMEFSEKTTKRTSLVQDITHLCYALEAYKKGLKSCTFDLSTTKFYLKIMESQFDYFYDGETSTPSIRSTETIYDEDPSFKKMLINTENKLFPQRGNFIRCCVRISNKDSVIKK